jgi:hypothetical protein
MDETVPEQDAVFKKCCAANESNKHYASPGSGCVYTKQPEKRNGPRQQQQHRISRPFVLSIPYKL